jgi:hypothetical protein
MPKSKTLQNIHAKRYIDTVFAEKLQEAGFVCPDDKHLCWYRVRNKEILDSIIFFSCWSDLPVWLDVAYGIQPLFAPPVFTNSVYFSNRPNDPICFRETYLREDGSGKIKSMRYSEEIQVYAPGYNGRGIYTLEQKLLPLMESIKSFEDIYSHAKKLKFESDPHITIEQAFWVASGAFIDLIIYLNDQELYPYCHERTSRAITWAERDCRRHPSRKDLKVALQHWKERETAFTGGRDEYLKILEQRKEENIQFLNKKFGIII